MEQRKLSDILIEIAMQGLKSPSAAHSEVMHPLMWLAHVAWNREVAAPEYLHGQLEGFLAKFEIEESVLSRDLITRAALSTCGRAKTKFLSLGCGPENKQTIPLRRGRVWNNTPANGGNRPPGTKIRSTPRNTYQYII